MIGRAGVGVDNVDVEAATRRGIIVANAPESTVISAAEHTVALLLALSRHIPQAHAALAQGRWERSRFGGIELAGKTLGVLGFGRIGQQVARRALGLEMRVVALRPVRVEGPLPRARRRARRVARRSLRSGGLRHAAPAAERRRRGSSIGADAFAKMRDGVRLVNAARGELVDEDALARGAALGQGRRGGARRLLDGAVLGPAARARERRRDAAPRRVDRGGAGSRGRDRRGADRRRARGRPRHERGEHPDAARRGSRGARRRTSRSPRSSGASRWSSRRAAPSGSSSRTTARSRSTTRACSPSRR